MCVRIDFQLYKILHKLMDKKTRDIAAEAAGMNKKTIPQNFAELDRLKAHMG